MSEQQELIATESLSDSHCLTLNALLDTMIPPDRGLSIPGAGDPAIVDQVLKSLRSASIPRIAQGLSDIENSTLESTGRKFSDLDQSEREKWFNENRFASEDFVRILGSLAIHCYYTDARVMESLGMEARSPFPDGFEIEQGDWSLLEPVKAKPKIYRETT